MEYSGFIGPSNVTQSPLQDQQRTVNLYLEESESPGASTRAALYQIPGVTRLSSVTAGGPGRAHIYIGGREFAIIGPRFIEIDSDGLMTVRGQVGIDENPATIHSSGLDDDGGEELLIVSATNAFRYEMSTNVLTQIPEMDGKATMGETLDGFGLILDSSASKVWISTFLDFSEWEALQFISRTQAPDLWVSMKVSNKYLYLLGSQTGEVWFNAGTSPIPFQPHPSGLFNFGCSSPWSPEVVGSALCWAGGTANGTGVVLRATGFQPQVISTYATETAFDGYPIVADAIGDSYDEMGHTFYLLTLPTAGVTWAWDESTQAWSERGTWNSSSGRYTAWRPVFHAYAFNQHRMLDSETGDLWLMANSIYTDVNGNGIRWLRRAPAIIQENRYVKYGTFELAIDVGRGLTGAVPGSFDALSAVGAYVIAASPNGDIYAAVNAANIWKQTAGTGAFADQSVGPSAWRGICTTPGNNVYACVYGGTIWKFTYGVGWADLSETSRNWIGMTGAPSENVYCGVFGGDVYVQVSGAGAFTGIGDTSRQWTGFCADGSDVWATVYSGDIYKRENETGVFVATGQLTNSWNDIACDGSGNLYAVADNTLSLGGIYVRSNGVGAFNLISGTEGKGWTGITVAPNGDIYACIASVDIYESTPIDPQGVDPQVMMRMSNDNGITWGNEHWRSAGKIGKYGQRVRWTRGGIARKRVYEVSGSDPVRHAIMGAWLEAE